MTNQIFLAYDGDNAGRLVGRAILANDAGALSEVSSRINLGHDVVKKWVQEHNGQVISGGGDEGLFSLPAEAVQDIEELRQDYEFATNLTMTIGVGQNLSEAGKSLMVGKFRGKDQVVMYDESIEQEIEAAQGRVSQGQGSEEETKISDAYLSNDKNGGKVADNKFQQDSQQIDQIKKEKSGQTPSQLATESPEQKAKRETGVTSAKTSAKPEDQTSQDPALTEESPQQASAKTNSEAAAKVAESDPKVDKRPGDAAPEDRQNPEKTNVQTQGLPDKKQDKQKEEEIGQANKHASGKEMSTPREKAEATGKDPSKDEFKGAKKESENMKKAEEKPKKEVKNEKVKEPPKEAPPGDQEVPPQGQEAHSSSCPTCGKPQEEAVEVIEENVDTPTSDETVQQQQMNGVDNSAMPVGNEFEGNVSRPDGFEEQNVPGDVGMEGGPEGGVAVENGNPEETQDDMMGQAAPGDEAIPGQEQAPGEESDPNMQGVMQDGLDAGADDAQAEQVKQMIGQALSGFKNNKQILERAQAQAPELYSSCIAMLRAMIEMAKMLGLSDGTEQLPNEQQGAQGQPGEQIPGQEEQPCPTCGKGAEKAPPGKEGGFPPKKDGKAPENKDGKEAKPEGKGGFPPKKEDGKEPKKEEKSAAPKEGSANESPKGNKPGGGGLGKLPTKATTQHVARTPLTPGSINLKGQQKTIDQKTGKTRWIDRKKGVVMGPSGVPVKAAAQENN
jgi:hypothetical protein